MNSISKTWFRAIIWLPPDRWCFGLELAARAKMKGHYSPLGLSFGLSRADGADADCRHLLFDPLGAALVPGGKGEPGLALVLRLGFGGQGSPPCDLLGEPSRPLPRERYPAQGLRGGGLWRHDGGLVGGEGFAVDAAVDASVIEANASRFRRVEGSEVDWTHERRARRPVSEYLVALESGNPPTTPERAPKAISPSGPCADWTTRGRHEVMFGYSLNYLIDMGQRRHRRCRGDDGRASPRRSTPPRP